MDAVYHSGHYTDNTPISSGRERERECEREIYYAHSASLAYEDGIVFMS